MLFKSLIISCSIFLASAGNVTSTEMAPVMPFEGEPCTVDATFETGGSSVHVTVTHADGCGAALATLGAIAEALD